MSTNLGAIHTEVHRTSQTALMQQVVSQIIQDYAVIMGQPQAQDAGNDRELITDALSRQPHLYAYYRDREYWGAFVMADLKEKLGTMGLLP